MTRAIPWQAVKLVRDFESYRSTAYLCSAGHWTLGWGHTLAVHEGQTCSHHMAEYWLNDDLAVAAKRVERHIGPTVVEALTPGQWAALVDLVFNLGDGPAKGSPKEWQIWRLLRAKDFDAIPAQLQRFVYDHDPKTGKPRKLAGLVRRRAAEIEFWNTEEPGLSHAEANSADLRNTPTPPAPMAAPKPAPLVAAATGCVTMCGVAVKTVSDAIQPFAEQSPWVGQAVAVLATVGAVVAVVTVGLLWLQRQHART